jgi:hypothetical protein
MSEQTEPRRRIRAVAIPVMLEHGQDARGTFLVPWPSWPSHKQNRNLKSQIGNFRAKAKRKIRNWKSGNIKKFRGATANFEMR